MSENDFGYARHLARLNGGHPPGPRLINRDPLEARINELTKQIAKLQQQVKWLTDTQQQQYDVRKTDWFGTNF